MTQRSFSFPNISLLLFLAEARMCCAGQLVILAGDFNADSTVIPSLC